MNCTVSIISVATRCRSVSGSPSSHVLSSVFIARNHALPARTLAVLVNTLNSVNKCPRFPFDNPHPFRQPIRHGYKLLHRRPSRGLLRDLLSPDDVALATLWPHSRQHQHCGPTARRLSSGALSFRQAIQVLHRLQRHHSVSLQPAHRRNRDVRHGQTVAERRTKIVPPLCLRASVVHSHPCLAPIIGSVSIRG